ncbi:MAG: hypothetical protein IT196_07500 [Acidimicrobiales bacterium]|nr:hypothetical protein [Acidimicrobiales bacterium]
MKQRSGSVVEAVRSIAPILVAGRSWADAHAQMAPAVVEAAGDAGAFVMVAPREVGGWEATLPEILRCSEDLGAADPTVAWHSGNSHALGGVAAYLAVEDRERVFAGRAGPYGFSAAMKGVARPVDGGYLVSGRWPMVTGALDVQWAALGGVVEEGGGPRQVNGMVDGRLFVVSSQDFVIERTWDAAPTMRGTGSHAVTLEEAFVPEGLAHSWLRPKVIDRPLYSLPSAFAGPVNNAAIAVGILRAAAEHATGLVAGKASSVDGTMLYDRSRYVTAVARATSAARALSAGLQAMASEVWAEAETKRVSREARAHMWSTAYWTLDAARRELGELTVASTSSVYGSVNPTEAGLRDIHAICASMEPARDLQEAAGRVLVGQRPNVAMF